MNRTRGPLYVCTLVAAFCLLPSAGAFGEGAATPMSPEEYNSTKSLQLEAPAFLDRIRISGRVQAMWKMWGDEEDTAVGVGDVFEKEGFRVPRWRLGVAASLFQHVRLVVTIGESEYRRTHDVNLLDANITLDYFDFANLTVGAAKVPVGRQTLTSSRDMQFVMRPVIQQQLTVPTTEGDVGAYNGLGIPERDVGITLSGRLWEGILKYYAGMYNGEGEYFRGNIDGNYSCVLRAVVNPLGDYPDMEGDFFRCLKASLGASGFYNNVFDAQYIGWGVDGELKGYGLSIRGEYLHSQQEPDLDGDTVDPLIKETTNRDGFFIQAGYFVWPNYLELAYRYEQFDDNNHLEDNGDIKYHTVGLNYYIKQSHFYKLQLNYVARQEDGPKLQNDAVYALLQVAF